MLSASTLKRLSYQPSPILFRCHIRAFTSVLFHLLEFLYLAIFLQLSNFLPITMINFFIRFSLLSNRISPSLAIIHLFPFLSLTYLFHSSRSLFHSPKSWAPFSVSFLLAPTCHSHHLSHLINSFSQLIEINNLNK